MPRRLSVQLKEAIEANKALVAQVEKYEKMPDLIVSADTLLKCLSRAVDATTLLVTPHGWTFWLLKIGGAFIKGAFKDDKAK